MRISVGFRCAEQASRTKAFRQGSVDRDPADAYHTLWGYAVGLTDTISFTCSACGHTADFPRSQEGKAIYCPKCQAAQVVKSSGTGRIEAERIPTGRIVKAETGGTDRIAKSHGMAGTSRIDFVCGACNHTSRISAALSGQPVRCPTCGTVQLAGVTGLRVVRLDESGKLPFTCTACSYQARLGAEYGGKAIRCPKCQGAQVVPRVLRDPSGDQPALPSGASVVRSEPGTGSVRRPGTGAIAKPVADPSAPRSEPSAALRTPAGGITVPPPMPTPTPLPGALVTPPPGALRAPTVFTTPLPTEAPPPPSEALPGDDLELGNSEQAPGKPRGGVVRRSGRMSAMTTPPPPPSSAEPTLEPARAVNPDPADQQVAAAPARAYGSPAPAPARGSPAWLVPVLGVGCVVALILAVVLGLMMSAADGRAAESQSGEQSAKRDLDAVRQQLVDEKASKSLIQTERVQAVKELDELRKEHEQLKADLGRARAEAAAAKDSQPGSAAPGKPGAQ